MQPAELHQSWQDLKSLRFLKLCVVLLLTVLVLTIALLLWRTSAFPPVVPFYYSLPWGEEQLASPLHLWFMIIGTVLIVLTNWTAAWIIRPKSAFLSNTLIVSAAIILLLGLYTVWRIVFLVT